MQVWDADQGQLLRTTQAHRHPVTGLAWKPDSVNGTAAVRLVTPGLPPYDEHMAEACFKKIDGKGPLLFLCDHAGNVLPSGYGTLGLDPALFDTHIAYDIGAAHATRALADAFGAPAVLGVFSRLLIDLNRETGAALVVATHNERFASALGRCLRLEHGRLHEVQADAPWTAGGVEGHRA